MDGVWRSNTLSNEEQTGPRLGLGLGAGGPTVKKQQQQQPKVFIDFFYRDRGEMQPWFTSEQSEVDKGKDEVSNDEENLLDDVQDCGYISRTASIDSSRSFTRNCSMESQDSIFYDEDEKENEVVLRVPMCCQRCVEQVKALTQLEGVSLVIPELKTEKVTLIGTASPSYILAACKKRFSQTTLWSPDDEYKVLTMSEKVRREGSTNCFYAHSHTSNTRRVY